MSSSSEAGSYVRLIDVVSPNSRLESYNEEETTRQTPAIKSTASGVPFVKAVYKGTSLIRNQPRLGPDRRSMPRALCRP